MPVCKTYGEAKAQRDKVQARRVELITLNEPLIGQFKEEEAKRKAEADTKAAKEKKEKEDEELEQIEVS